MPFEKVSLNCRLRKQRDRGGGTQRTLGHLGWGGDGARQSPWGGWKPMLKS